MLQATEVMRGGWGVGIAAIHLRIALITTTPQ